MAFKLSLNLDWEHKRIGLDWICAKMTISFSYIKVKKSFKTEDKVCGDRSSILLFEMVFEI